MSKVKDFFKGAFEDMKESAKAQHEVDKANFAAAKKNLESADRKESYAGSKGSNI